MTEQLMLSLFHCLPKTQINIVIDSENQMTWSQSSRVYSGIGETAVTQAKRLALTGLACMAQNVQGQGESRHRFPEEAVSGLNLNKWVEHALVRAACEL